MWRVIDLILIDLWAGVGTEGSSGRVSVGNASEPGLRSEDWPGRRISQNKLLTHPHHLNTQNLIHLKATPPNPTVRKQVSPASLPQTLAPRRWTQGFFCTALPVEPHSCRTPGCTWSTSSDTALSWGKYLQPEHAPPCRRHKVKQSYM